jgi:hypothetical protein
MARSTLSPFRCSRFVVAALGVGLAGMLAASQGFARDDEPKSDPPKKAAPAKAEAKKADVRKPEPIHFAISPALDAKTAETVRMINKHLETAWEENKLTPSKLCDDYEFIRRASIDIIGRIAKPEEIQQYLAHPQATRRADIINDLLKSEDYPKNWANMWANWLLTRSGAFGSGMYREQMYLWLLDEFCKVQTKDHGPYTYDGMVRALLTAEGKNSDENKGAVNFILAHLGEENPKEKKGEEGQFSMVPITSRITRLFLGIQTQCTQCHDHPFDNNLTQQQFWGINAYLRQVKRDGTVPVNNNRMSKTPLTLLDDPNVNTEAVVYFEKVKNSLVRQTKATFLDGSRISVDPAAKTPINGLDRRKELATRIIDHPNFPKAIVNRMWAHFMGKGFTQPFDDFNEQNQVSMPELLDELAAAYKHYGYDQKMLIRWICNSHAYSLCGVANRTNEKEDAEKFFSRMLLKMQSPEQLFDSLMVATKTPDGERKALRERWQTSLIANFGDDEGNEVSFNGTVVQALMMMNGKDINDVVSRTSQGTLYESVEKKKHRGEAVIRDLYMAALNRPPTPKETATIGAAFALGRGVRDKDGWGPYQDLFWAILNSNEFMLNH